MDDHHYTGWTDLISNLWQSGVRVLTYINPLIDDITHRSTPYKHNYYNEGLTNDYFIKLDSGQVWKGYSSSCLVDLTNPQAYNWILEMIVEVCTTPIAYSIASNESYTHIW